MSLKLILEIFFAHEEMYGRARLGNTHASKTILVGTAWDAKREREIL